MYTSKSICNSYWNVVTTFFWCSFIIESNIRNNKSINTLLRIRRFDTRAVCNLHQHASGPSVCSMDIQLSTGCCELIFMEASNTWGGYRNHRHIGQSPFLYFLYWRCFSLCSFIILGEVKYPYTRFALLLFKLLLNLGQVHVVFSNYA